MTEIIFPVLGITTALLGPVMSSFFSVVVMRQENLTKVRSPHSACDSCGVRLRWFDLVPVLSFLIKRGRCSECGNRIDIRLFINEVLGLLFFALLGLHLGTDLVGVDPVVAVVKFIVAFASISFLLYLSVYDVFTFSIPALTTNIFLGFTVIVNALVALLTLFIPNLSFDLGLGGPGNLLMGLIAGASVWLVIWLTKQRGMGEGDIRIAVAVGLLLGWPLLVSAFYITVLSATMVGLVYAAQQRQFKGLLVPLVPFISLGYIGALVFGNQIFNFLFFGAI